MSLGGACKAVVLPIVSLADFTETDDYNQRGGGRAKYYLAYIVHLLLMIVAGYLAWNCNVGETSLMRIIYTVFAAFFSGLYLIYYLIYRVLMGVPCVVGAATISV